MRRVLKAALILLVVAAIPASLQFALRQDVRALFIPHPLQKDEVLFNDAETWNPPPVWVDARSRSAFDRSHIKGAYLLTLDESENFEALLFQLHKSGALNGSRPVIIYDDSANASLSRAVADRLRQRYADVQVFRLHGRWPR